MAPIRVGFIGLGRTAGTMVPGIWGVVAHLPSLIASPNYEIVALANSTVESAQASIEHHKLGPSVKAYGNPADIANDPDVDLVLCSVAVAKHYELIKPALEAGKAVFVEWPLGATLAQCEELTELARAKNVKTIVGCQSRADPIIVKIKELIDNGTIGKVLSSTVTGTIADLPPMWPESVSYYMDIESGGNTHTIFFGHYSFVHALGNFSSLNSILKTEQKTIKTIKDDGTTYDYTKTAPDQIFVQGTLDSGALASINFRYLPSGKSVDGTAVRWTVTGDKGEIQLITSELYWQFGFPDRTLKIRVGDGEVQDVDFAEPKEEAFVSSVNLPGTNSARVWDAFVKGESDKFPDFEKSLEVHRLLEAIRAGKL